MADALDPSTPGLSYSQYPPELQQEAASLKRRRALVDLMLMRAMQPPPTPTSGGITLPVSPFASLAQLGGGLAAATMGRRADAQDADLSSRYAQGLSDAQFNVGEMIKNKDYTGAAQVAGRYPAMKSITEKLLERQFPQNAFHTTYNAEGKEQPSIVDMNNPGAPPLPVGGPKIPPLHPVESADEGGLPQTSFVDLSQPSIPPVPKPVKLGEVNTGGENTLYNPYSGERTGGFIRTPDPSKIPTPEEIEADARMIAENRKPGYGSSGGRMQPWQADVMRRVDVMTGGKYDASVYPVAKAGEINFLEKNGPQINAFGTLARHVEAARDLFKTLDNPTDIPRLNQARNFFQQEFGVAAPTQVNLAKQFIADEMAKAVLNGPGALDDRKHFAEALSRSASTAQFEGDLDTTMRFAVEKLKGHEQQYKSATKSNRQDFQERFLDPQMKTLYNKYGGGRRAADQGGLPSPAAIDAELARRAASGQ